MKQEFIDLFNAHIKREGADNLLAWLGTSDFFKAPASTKYHLAVEGGLCTHSVNVYKRLLERYTALNEGLELSAETNETIAICALLHDLCKVNFYTVEFRNAKNEAGNWVKVPFYAVDDQLPYGHGEKSVYIISGFMRLSREESMAIRWHMGGFDDSVKGGSYALSGAFEKYPLALYLHIADLEAAYLDEKEEAK